jgi:hypothetical protein
MQRDMSLSNVLIDRWHMVHALTYDCLAILEQDHLHLTLPFPESLTLGSQFRCMLGAQESYLREVERGAWQGFTCSLDALDNVTPAGIARQMRRADTALADTLRTTPLTTHLQNGKYVHAIIQRLIEHETLHHGQLINFLFCHHLPIPHSWGKEWALTNEE